MYKYILKIKINIQALKNRVIEKIIYFLKKKLMMQRLGLELYYCFLGILTKLIK